MTKRPNTHISVTEKDYCVIMTSFLTKTLEILHDDLSCDCICNTKFRLIRIQGSEVKRGAESDPPSERVFEIPVRVGLSIDKQRHRLLLLKTRIHVVPTHL